MDKVDFRIIIPARFASTRLPGKPLRMIGSKTMIQRVWECAKRADPREIIIATDDERISQEVRNFGGYPVLTSGHHKTGSDRICEVVSKLGFPDDDIIVNLQGDEPMMPEHLLVTVAKGLRDSEEAGISTLCTPIASRAEFFSKDVVKVVMDAEGFALYFSRSPIPARRDGELTDLDFSNGSFSALRHLGIYGYRVGVLKRMVSLPQCSYEVNESLEQLRAMWNGIRIRLFRTDSAPPQGVDSPEDLERIQKYFPAD
ncbi:MAG: 3-deoxy-manno-octulosonate cytidylyltransferase [Oligoflexales bacterium]|nr:3-deoxy-manno-octulosonate cytidylyltransferase [Oligoflexales bacterium]